MMLRQTFSVPSRTIGSSLRQAVRRQIIRPQFYRAPIAAAARATGPLQRTRWYSDQPESKEAETKKAETEKAGTEDAAESGDGAVKEESIEATLRKQLEAKEAEIRDWKVCCPSTLRP